jgi:hypothetical protein
MAYVAIQISRDRTANLERFVTGSDGFSAVMSLDG